MTKTPIGRDVLGFRLSLLVIGATLGCAVDGQEARPSVAQQPESPLQELHRSLHGAIPEDAEWSEVSEGPVSIGIAIERTSCYGTCPTYTVAFEETGRGVYCGFSFVEKIGTYEGEIDPELVAKVAAFVQEEELSTLSTTYLAMVTDAPLHLLVLPRRRGSASNLELLLWRPGGSLGV